MTHLIGKDSHRMDVKGWDTIFQANRGQKQGVTIPDLLDQTQQISSRIGLNQYILIKNADHQ